MKTLVLLTAVVVAAGTLTTAPSSGAPRKHEAHGSVVVQVAKARHAVGQNRTKTWYFQDERGVPRTATRYAERHTRSAAYLHWLVRLWSDRRVQARRALLSDRLPSTGDWLTAVRIVQRVWPGTQTWMLSCSGAEGSHGIWVWNGGEPYSAGGAPTSYSHGYRMPPYGSSGAGGWMQFMEGTWSGQYNGALELARQEHLPIPMGRDALWTSPVGQAFAAGWGYSHARSAWTGDPACA